MSLNLLNPASSGASGYGVSSRRCNVRFQQRCETRHFRFSDDSCGRIPSWALCLLWLNHHRNRTPVTSVESMEDQQSSGHCGSSQQHEHSVSSHRGSVHLPETSISASNSSAASSHQQLHFASRVERQATLAEKEDSLSPAVPSLLHLPLCRQTTPVPGLRYRNLGKSGLRVSNVGLGTVHPHLVAIVSSILISLTHYLFVFSKPQRLILLNEIQDLGALFNWNSILWFRFPTRKSDPERRLEISFSLRDRAWRWLRANISINRNNACGPCFAARNGENNASSVIILLNPLNLSLV